MADDIIQEFDTDALKTTAKSLGSRVRDAALATAGSYVGRGGEAHGRLFTRTMADRMLQGWLMYKGASGRPPTRANIYQFLRKHYARYINDGQLRQLVGIPPRPSPSPGSPNAASAEPPDPRQGEMFTQGQMGKGATTQPTAQPTPAPAIGNQAAAPSGPAQPAQPQAKRITTGDVQKRDGVGAIEASRRAEAENKANGFPPAAQPIHAPAQPSAATPATPQPASTTPNASGPAVDTSLAGKPKPQVRMVGDIQREDGVSGKQAALTQAQEFEAVQAWKQANPDWNKRAPAAPTSSTTPPAQPPAPAAPQAAPNAAVQPTPAPQSQPAVQPAQANPAPQQAQAPASIATRDGWRAFKTNMRAMLKQPQPDPATVMQALANALKQTRKDTPERNRLVNYIGGLQTNWEIANKVPQLRQLPLPQVPMESFQPSGQRLREDANDVLPRSAIDKIFLSVAQTLVANSDATGHDDEHQPSQLTQPESDPKKVEDDDFETYGDRLMTMENLRRAIRTVYPSLSDMRNAGKIITDKLKEMTDKRKHVTLRQLLDGLRKDGRRIDRMPGDIKKVLIYAARIKS